MIAYDNFKQIFLSGKPPRPYWWLYLGKSKTNGTPIGSNSEEGDLEASWGMLAELLENYGDGVFTIEVKTSVQSPRNNPTHTFYLGDRPGVAGAAVGSVATQADAFTKGIDMRYWMDKTDTLQDKVRVLELEKLSLQNQLSLERMKRKEAEQAAPDTMSRILGVVERNPAVLAGLSGLFGVGERPAAIGQLRGKKPPPPPPPPASDDDDEEDDVEDWDNEMEEYDQVTGSGNFSIDRAVNACYRLTQSLPGQDINLLLEKIASVAETDPGKIEMALKFL